MAILIIQSKKKTLPRQHQHGLHLEPSETQLRFIRAPPTSLYCSPPQTCKNFVCLSDPSPGGSARRIRPPCRVPPSGRGFAAGQRGGRQVRRSLPGGLRCPGQPGKELNAGWQQRMFKITKKKLKKRYEEMVYCMR